MGGRTQTGVAWPLDFQCCNKTYRPCKYTQIFISFPSRVIYGCQKLNPAVFVTAAIKACISIVPK